MLAAFLVAVIMLVGLCVLAPVIAHLLVLLIVWSWQLVG